LHPNRRDDLLAGPLIFYGLRNANRAALRHPSEAFRTVDGEYPPLKIIAEVRANALATVSIARRDRERARLVFGLPFPRGKRRLGLRLEEGQIAVRFEGCTPSQGRFSSAGAVGRRTQFNGGFLFTRPQCLRILVYDHLARRRRRYIAPYGRPPARCQPRRAQALKGWPRRGGEVWGR
jgi:hypothetical protein